MEQTIQPLVTPARYGKPGEQEQSINVQHEHKFVTAVSPLDLNGPINDETMKKYSTLVRRVMKQMHKSTNSTMNYIEFKVALELADVFVLESRVIALFEVTTLKRNNLMSANDFEIALMINDSYPVQSYFVPIFELFLSYDIDRDGRLDFEQFKECINTLTYEGKSDPKDSAFLAYLFRKSADKGKIDYITFVRLWCTKIADVKNVLGSRGLLNQKKSRDTFRRISGFFTSVWKYFQLKDILQQEMLKPGYDIITQFDQVRKRVVDLRIQLQRQKDNEKRATKLITRKQKRSGTISASKHKKQMSVILQNEGAKTIMMLDENRLMREKIMKDCKNAELKIDLEYHRRKQEKLDQEVLNIQRTCADRLNLCDQELTEVPPSLYSSQESKLKLSDVKILDLSQNSLLHLPSSGFLFHLNSLRKLCLSRNCLRTIPDEISCLANLEILKVDENQLTTIPTQLNSLKCLQILDLSVNHLSGFQEDICNLSKLKILKLNSNRITVLPSSIEGLANLQSIDLSSNSLTHLPDGFCSLKCLVQINISNNRISDLPYNFGNLQQLEDLDVSYNQLKNLPESFSNLICLHQFNFKYNKLFGWGESMDGLRKLQSFEGMNNECTEVSKKIEVLASLQRFSLPINQVRYLPPEIGMLKVLIHLDIHNNQIEQLPVQIGALSNLQYLDISQNKISSLPHEFCLLKSLIAFNSAENKLETLPHHFGSLRNLRILNISSNKLTCLPVSFDNLTKLEELDISCNKLDVIRKQFCERLKSLRIANLDSNSIQHLPKQICHMDSLQLLTLRKNKLNSLPLEMLHSKIEIDITLNPLKDLPFKFHSTVKEDVIKDNPSGYDQVEVHEWMKSEKLLYQPAVDEWDLKIDSYLSDRLTFKDFQNGIVWRCDNIYEGIDSNIFKEDKRILKRLKQFYFHCKKYGNPPLYLYRDNHEEDKRQSEAKILHDRRHERMNIARKIDLKRREDEYHRYFGNLHKRCINTELRIKGRQESLLELKRGQTMNLLNDVSKRIEASEKAEAAKKVESQKASAKEAERLNSISFKIYKNRKRYLPIEINPCWKPAHIETKQERPLYNSP